LEPEVREFLRERQKGEKKEEERGGGGRGRRFRYGGL
jgi:hypothetical protein